MTDCEQLRKILRQLGWSLTRCSDLEAALYLADESGKLVSELVGTLVAYGCAYHVRQTAAAYAREMRHPLIDAARRVTGGPQADPGDETLPMFDEQ